MKNNLLTALAIECASFTFGQYAPNGGFESWTEIPTYQVPDTDPADFLSSSAETFVIAFASSNVLNEDQDPRVGCILMLDNLEFSGSDVEIPGGDFETWGGCSVKIVSK